MINLCWAILFLGIMAAINWALGLYDKIGVERLTWDWKTFAQGAAKIIILVGALIGIGFVWQYSGIDLTGAGYEPLTLVNTGTIYYAYKVISRTAGIIHAKKSQDSIDDTLSDVIYEFDTTVENEAPSDTENEIER